MIRKENLLTKKAGISYFQISLLIISSFAFSYLIYEASQTNENLQEVLNKNNIKKSNLITNILTIIIKQLTKPMLPEVSATSGMYTCKEDKSGGICQEYTPETCDSNCKTNCFPGGRDDFSECKSGCCINPDGKCQAGASKAECEVGGTWKDNAACNPGNVVECRLGCCVLGSSVKPLVTEAECQFYSADLGLEEEYYSGENELDCLARALTQAKGACVTGENCKILTEQECYALTGSASNFHEDILCTNPGLNTTCEKTQETTCVPGKDEVYFIDSCGNPANIYDASKINNDEYWKKIISKAESCDSNSNNKESKSCGNCDYFLGSKCKLANSNPSYGDYACVDMSCKDAPDNQGKKDRKNGESWCLFDGAIGQGKDLVGSRYFRTSCIDGEVKVEPCADFRNEVCSQKDVVENGISFSQAQCRINSWQECIEANTEEEECPGNYCFTKSINVDDEFGFDACLPEYPPGFEIKEKGSSKEICGLATQKCTVVYQKKLSWKCKVNCDCEKAEFSQKMNEFCTGLGDCGFKMNIAGESTKNYRVIGAPKAAKVIGDLIWRGNYPYPGDPEDFVNNGTLFNNLAAALSAMGSVQEMLESSGSFDPYLLVIGVIVLAIAFIFVSFGWALGIAAAVVIILMIFGWGKTKEKIVEFKCQPWQPPIGGNDCNKCGDELKPCSKYRCESLGAACKFLNEGTTNEICEKSKDDGKAPIIIPWQGALLDGYKYEEITGGIKVTGEKECIPAYTPIQFGIRTTNTDGEQEASQCKYDLVHKSTFDDMEEYFGDSNLFLYNHSMALSLPSVDYIAEQFISEDNNLTRKYIEEKYGNLKFLIRCQDDWGNFNVNEYLIQVCVSPEPDTTPPIINKYEPANHAYLAYNVTEQDVTIYTNEPANCKYSEENKKYEDMENSFSCLIDLEYQEALGWPCETSLNITSGENKFYIKCGDKPWLPENHKNISVNQESYEYVLKKSSNELKIDSVEPSGEIIGGAEPFSVSLEVHTSGGAEQGKAGCSYKWGNNWNLFYSTFSYTHIQQGLSLLRGNYDIQIKCEDVAGNIVESSVSFKLKLDTSAPSIVRAYKSSSELYIYTNEDSTCAFSYKNCRFRFENGTLMSGGLGKEHSTDWTANTYYIKCKDSWGNEPGGCSIKIQPENV